MYLARVRLRVLIATFLIWSLPAGSALADDHPRAAISSVISASKLAAHGKVQAATVQRDDRGQIFTEVEVRLLELWKGEHPGEIIYLVHPGGALGGVEITASGQPQYKPGEEVVLFCVKNAAGKYVTVGLGNGKFTVANGMASNPRTDPSTIPLAELKAKVK